MADPGGDRAEAGREAFFRGRDAEYEVFRSALTSFSKGTLGGGTMVFQGAPGAGKSALMAECMEAVQLHSTPESPWVAVSINPHSLQSPIDVIETIVDAVHRASERQSQVDSSRVATKTLDGLLNVGKRLYRELLKCGGGTFGLSVGGHRNGDVTAGRVFRNSTSLLRKYHIVICVDEAQNIPVSDTTRDVIDCLHQASHGIPLLAAFFGLSDTQDILRQCGLSRFADGRVVNLQPLLNHDALDAIQSVFDAYQFTGTPKDRAAWVESLAELSQGWPQHINRVAVAAAEVIHDHSDRIERTLLKQALKRGKERKDDYYAARLAVGSNRAWVYKELALAAEEKGGSMSYDLIASLTECARQVGRNTRAISEQCPAGPCRWHSRSLWNSDSFIQ